MIFPRKGHGDDGFEAYIRPGAITDGEWKELRKFQGDLSFTVAKLEDKFALLDGYAISPDGNRDITITVISDSRVEIVETGSMVTGEPSIPFALYR